MKVARKRLNGNLTKDEEREERIYECVASDDRRTWLCCYESRWAANTHQVLKVLPPP